MRWLQELLVPGAILVTLAAFWVVADARALEQRAQSGDSASDPALAWHVLHPNKPPVQNAAQAKPMASKPAPDGR